MDGTLLPTETPRPALFHQRQARCLPANPGRLFSQEKHWPFMSMIAAWQHGLVDICWLRLISNIFPCQVEQITGVDSGGYATLPKRISMVKSSNRFLSRE